MLEYDTFSEVVKLLQMNLDLTYISYYYPHTYIGCYLLFTASPSKNNHDDESSKS